MFADGLWTAVDLHVVQFALCWTIGYQLQASLHWFSFVLDRCKGELVDFIVGDNRIENAYLLMYKILTNNENKNFNIEYHDTLNTIDYLCTDGHHAYDKVANHPLFKHNIKHHIISKSEIQSPSYASLLAITNLLLGTVWDEFTK